MTNITPPNRTNTLHATSGVLLATSEATALAAGNSIVYQNRGNDILRIVVTTAGTGTIVALSSANNVSLTLSVGDNLIGPLDPGVFGSTVTINTATAVGSCALYVMPSRFLNGLHNPFELVATAADA